MLNKLLKTFLALALTVTLFGCQKTPEPDQSFDEFISVVEKDMIDGTTSFNMNFLINDPKALGFEEPDTYGIGYSTKEEYEEMYDTYAQYQKQLQAYDYDKLSDVQKRTYDVLDDYLSRQIVLKDYYYYDNDVFGSYSTFVQELPLLLQMYAFNDVDDLENYFKDIAAFKDDFINYINFEKERQELGLGFSSDILEDTRSQLEDIIAEGGKETITEVNAVIDTLSFLNDDEKSLYKQKNEEAIGVTLIDAYQTLLDGLKEIEGQPETKGLYDLKNGKDYYKAMVYNQLGIKDSIEDIESRLEDVFEENFAALQSFALTHYDLIADNEDYYNIRYSEFSTPEEGLDYLKTQIFNIVPEISDLDYRIYTVPESLQDGFAPAAYLSARIDMTDDQQECIMINPTSTENILPTLVHEGYPGHMYQHAYFLTLNYPTLHALVDCIGYTEGWAIYVENQASRFIADQDEADWQTLLIYDSNVTTPLLAIMDIGIHYHGWDYQDCVDYFKEKIGMDLGEDLRDLYDIIVQTPAYYLYYIYSGQILTDLHDQAEQTLGSKFDDIAFNQAILDSGPVGLDVVRRNVQNYIDANK